MRRTLLALAGLLTLGSGLVAPASSGPVPQAHPVQTVPATGALFYPSVLGLVPLLGGPHFCSASVVHSASRDLAVTAAHCVFGTGALIEFAPLLHDAQLPAGVWEVERIYIDPAWAKSFDPRHDVAFLKIAPRGGKKLEDVVAGQPLGHPQAGRPVTVSGYPMGSRGRPITCTAPLSLVSGYSALRCSGFGNGTSGGPWVQSGHVVGVIGGLEQGGCAPDMEYSTPFGASVVALFGRAVSGGRGDVVPIGFAANAC